MKTMLNYQVLLSKVAKKQYKLHNQKQEWKAFILFVFLIKVVTWAVSIFAGWHFFNLLIFKATGNAAFSATVSVIVLIAIEGATNLALAKFFKFTYRGTNHISTSLAMVFVLIMLFGISFYSSTQGLSMRQARRADNSPEIIEKYKLKATQAQKEYSAFAGDIDEQIITIKSNPQGWTRGRRTTLLTWQLNKIDSLLFAKSEAKQSLKNELKQIQQAKNYELSQNTRLMNREADKYYNIVMVIMIVQFITSGMLMFFWKIIHTEDDTQSIINEELNELNEIVSSNAFYAFKNQMHEISNAFAVAMLEKTPAADIPLAETEPETERVKISGFQTENNTNADTRAHAHAHGKSPEPSKRVDSSAVFKMQKTMQNNIEYLRRHKQIVRSIKLLKIPEKSSISNAEIQKIQQLARAAPYKSETTIRQVYRVAVTVGLNKINENGDIIN